MTTEIQEVEQEVKKEVVVDTEEQRQEVTDLWKQERMRHQYYGFLRTSKKPLKGERKAITFPEIKDEEDVNEFFDRCHEETGCRPAPVGPVKKQPANKKCHCKSGKKFKRCCGRGF